MRGDSEYSGQHKHGVTESARPASGVHLMSREKPAVSKEIKKISTSFRGHMLLTFADGTTHELQRGDYPHNVPPKVGDFYPPLSTEQKAAQAVRENAEAGQTLDEALAETAGSGESQPEAEKAEE